MRHRLLWRRDRKVRRRKAKDPDADAFWREGPGHPDDGCRDDQVEAQWRQRDLCLPRRRPRLPLRRTWQLSRGIGEGGMAALHRLPEETFEEVDTADFASLRQST